MFRSFFIVLQYHTTIPNTLDTFTNRIQLSFAFNEMKSIVVFFSPYVELHKTRKMSNPTDEFNHCSQRGLIERHPHLKSSFFSSVIFSSFI